MLGVENPGNSKRRSNGADDEIAGCNFEGVSEEPPDTTAKPLPPFPSESGERFAFPPLIEQFRVPELLTPLANPPHRFTST
jgi:hypothetical protein